PGRNRQEERRAGTEDGEGDHLEQVRAEERASRAREAGVFRSRCDLENGDLRGLAQASGQNRVEEGADRARGVDRAEADGMAYGGRPGQRAQRLDRCADREARGEQLPIRARGRVKSTVAREPNERVAG